MKSWNRIFFHLFAYWLLGEIAVETAYRVFTIHTRGASLAVSGMLLFAVSCLIILTGNVLLLTLKQGNYFSISLWIIAIAFPFYCFPDSPRRASLLSLVFAVSTLITMWVFRKKSLPVLR